MTLQEIAIASLEQQLIKKLENAMDPQNGKNLDNFENLVKQTRYVKKLTHREFKKICKTAKDVPLTGLTSAWKK